MKPAADQLEVIIAGHKLLCSVRRSRRAKIVAIRINQTGLFELVIPERGSFEEARNFLESKKKFPTSFISPSQTSSSVQTFW